MNKIWLIFKKEMREVFRDKKSLAMMLIIPFMIPLLLIGFSYIFEDEMDSPEEKTYKIGFTYTLSDVEKSIIDNMNIEPVSVSLEEAKKRFQDREIELYITKDGVTYTLNGDSSEDTAVALSVAKGYLETYKTYLQEEYLASHGVNANEVFSIINVEEKLTEENNFFASYLTVYAFMFIIMAITVSSTYPATDATAGEKERGTLETLLTFPIKSRDIIIGKFLSVVVSSIITGLLSLVLMIASLSYAQGAFEIYKNVDLMLPTTHILLLVVIIVLYSILISGLCIAVASKSKTFKEAQSALTPLTFISFFPGMVAYMMNVNTTFVLSLIPFLNYTLIFNDMTNGIMNTGNIIAMFASTIVIIVIVLYVIIKQYKSEKVLF